MAPKTQSTFSDSLQLCVGGHSDANPTVVNYTWFRESEGQLKQLQTGDTLIFNRTDPTDSGWYHCTVQNQHGTQNSSVMMVI
ncbi:hypothetical protein M9458_053149, partial [Cirrhinus mrigala]